MDAISVRSWGFKKTPPLLHHNMQKVSKKNAIFRWCLHPISPFNFFSVTTYNQSVSLSSNLPNIRTLCDVSCLTKHVVIILDYVQVIESVWLWSCALVTKAFLCARTIMFNLEVP